MVISFCLHIQHQSTKTTCRLCKLSTVKIFPNAVVQMKKLTFVGTFSFHNGFHGKDSTMRQEYMIRVAILITVI